MANPYTNRKHTLSWVHRGRIINNVLITGWDQHILITSVVDPDPKDPYNVAWSGSDIFSRDPDPDLKLDHFINVKTKIKFAKLNLKKYRYLWNLSIYFSNGRFKWIPIKSFRILHTDIPVLYTAIFVPLLTGRYCMYELNSTHRVITHWGAKPCRLLLI